MGLTLALLAACGGGDSVDPDQDEELIEDALLTREDLPDGFEEEPVDDEDENDAVDECTELLGHDPDDVDDAKTAETDSVQFDSGVMSIRAQITAFDDGDIPREIIEGFEDDDFFDCFLEAITDALPEDLTIEDFDTDDLPRDDDAIDAGLTLELQLDAAGTAVDTRTYLALVDRYAIALDVTTRAGDMDEDVAADALDEMVHRLSDG